MEIVYQEEELLHYMENAVKINPEHPVLIDRYLTGKEIEVDAICDGKDVLIPGIMEHIERAGVHSVVTRLPFIHHKVIRRNQRKIVDYTKNWQKVLKLLDY